MARALIAVGVGGVRAYELARRVEIDLAKRDERSVELERLHELAVEILGPVEGHEAVERLRRYRDLDQLDMPVILLIGGATGTGKTTIAAEAAHRLGITRLSSTDFIRQTMRAFFSEEFMPTIHHSSFKAWEALPEAEREEGDPLIRGFLQQTKNVLVGVRASIERAIEEGWSMVLEGVHLVPGMLPLEIEGALVVQYASGRLQRGGSRLELLRPRPRHRGRSPGREVSPQPRRDPPDPGLPAQAGSQVGRSGDRE